MADATPTIDVSAKPPTRFRRLRIAVSVFFGVVIVVFATLWVRSYRGEDVICVPTLGRYFRLNSVPGRIYFSLQYVGRKFWSNHSWKGNGSAAVELRHAISDRYEMFGFALREKNGTSYVHVPHWFLVSAAAAAAISPWLRWKYSLRTLLVAITLVAVVLGLAVWAGR